MTFYAFGLNHETAPLRLREAFALNVEGKRRLLRGLNLSEEAEVVLLSTCNRTEAYLFGESEDVEEVVRALCLRAGHDWPSLESFHVEDEEAIAHVLRVASGLRSMIVGDAQILAQMKEAYGIAVDAGRVGTVLHRLMHTAFRTAKHVVSETAVGIGAASVPGAAVAMARSHVGGILGSAHVLLVGAGEVGRLILKALDGVRPLRLSITNRSAERAQQLGLQFRADVVPWERRHEAVGLADVVLVATSADEPILEATALPEVDAPEREILVVDLSVPRNADPAIGRIPGYRVVDMDELDAWIQKVEDARRLEVPRAEQLVGEELAEFVSWMFHQDALQPAIQAIRDTFERIRTQEIERHLHRFSDADRRDIDTLTRSIMQKLLAVPIVRLKAHGAESPDLEEGVRLLRMLFTRANCEDESAQSEHDPLEESPSAFDQLPRHPESRAAAAES